MLEELKELEQEAMDNLDPETWIYRWLTNSNKIIK